MQLVDADERFFEKMVYVEYCIHEKHNIPPRFDNHELDTEAHIGERSDCGKGHAKVENLSYIKYQDIEAEVEGQIEKWHSKKLITIVKTMSSQRQTATQGNQQPNRKHQRRRRQRQAQKMFC